VLCTPLATFCFIVFINPFFAHCSATLVHHLATFAASSATLETLSTTLNHLVIAFDHLTNHHATSAIFHTHFNASGLFNN
jgi:hypothetical protein